MFIKQFFLKGLAHSSYLLGGMEACAIVDPQRDIEIYREAAREMGMKITHILETHLHADFISGHLDLARSTGAKIYAPKSAHCTFDHHPLTEGDRFQIDHIVLEVIETPGHTPEHVSYLVSDTQRSQTPVCVFCGDTLFVGDVGRPDLFPGQAQELAQMLYDSLHHKLMKLPDHCEVYPAHGAGSLCGRAMSAKRTTTIGYEKQFNEALQISKKDAFVQSLTTNMPAAPDHFFRCSKVNAEGPALREESTFLQAFEPYQVKKRLEDGNAIIVDTRPYESFGGQHIPEAWNIDMGGNFQTFAGWVLPINRQIILVSENDNQAKTARIMLERVGLDHTIGMLKGGMFAWAKSGYPTSHVCQISSIEIENLMKKEPITLIDVRAPQEFFGSHIEGSENIEVQDLRTYYEKLDSNRKIALICATGHRSSLAASILRQRGIERVLNIAGGMTGFSAAGFAPKCRTCQAPHLPSFK